MVLSHFSLWCKDLNMPRGLIFFVPEVAIRNHLIKKNRIVVCVIVNSQRVPWKNNGALAIHFIRYASHMTDSRNVNNSWDPCLVKNKIHREFQHSLVLSDFRMLARIEMYCTAII